MDIYLVRHGEAMAKWGEDPDPGLSKNGKRQAIDLAKFLKRRLPRDVLLISSPLQRAQETAAPLAEVLNKKIYEDAAFREIPAPVPIHLRQMWLRQFMQQKWGEQANDLREWRLAAIKRLLELKGPAVVFTHFLVINSVVGYLLEQPQTLLFWPANGSVTRIMRTSNGLELLSLGTEMKTPVT